MKIFYGYDNFKIENAKHTSIAIGNFDGIHPGHKKIILKAVREGKRLNIPSGIFTFRTHPKNILFKKSKIKPILSLSQKLNIFKNLKVSFCIICDENKNFLHYSPEKFIREVLIKKLKTKVINVGKNFHFGENAKGNIDNLKIMQKDFGYQLNVTKLLTFKDKTISSTRIRKSITENNFHEANQLLKRKEFISAKIQKGLQFGKKLGFPTANVPCRLNETGVYLVKVWLKGKQYFGLLNYGKAPSVCNKRKLLCEIHILNYKIKKDLYGEEIIFQIIEKFREEKFFSSLTLLKNQILKDIKKAKLIIKKIKHDL